MAWRGLIDAYGDRMAIDRSRPVTLHEGNTPLIPAPRLADALCPGVDLWLKYEGLNPTGSFKDRGMTTAISQAAAEGKSAVICASTGNTSASAAAYAARAGMRCFVLVPDGKVAMGKLAGSIAYGATHVAIRGSFDDGLRLVQEISATSDIALVNSVNPARLEGQKTAAWEVCEQLGGHPDWLALPVGNAGNISAYWMGFTECAECACAHRCGLACEARKSRPKLLGVQAEGAAPLALDRPFPHPETRATAIRIGNPARAEQARAAIRESGGTFQWVTDEEIFAAYRAVARTEGVFCEPSSATGLAGLHKSYRSNKTDFEGRTIVAVLTGHGLKDPASAVEGATEMVPVDATLDALRKVLG